MTVCSRGLTCLRFHWQPAASKQPTPSGPRRRPPSFLCDPATAMVSIRSGEALLGMGPRAGPRWPGLGGEQGLGSPRPRRGEIMLGFRRPATPPHPLPSEQAHICPWKPFTGWCQLSVGAWLSLTFCSLILQLIQCGWYFLCLNL